MPEMCEAEIPEMPGMLRMPAKSPCPCCCHFQLNCKCIVPSTFPILWYMPGGKAGGADSEPISGGICISLLIVSFQCFAAPRQAATLWTYGSGRGIDPGVLMYLSIRSPNCCRRPWTDSSLVASWLAVQHLSSDQLPPSMARP